MLLENLDTFLGDFSTRAVLIQGGKSKSIQVIFDEEYLGMDLGSEGRSLTAFSKTSDIQGVNHRSFLLIFNKVFKVENVRPASDGQFTELVLKEYTGSIPAYDPIPYEGSVTSVIKAIKVPFWFSDVSPKPIYTAVAGTTIYTAQIIILNQFDVGAALSLGDANQPSRLISPSQVDPGVVCEYETNPEYTYQETTRILLTIVPGAGSFGSGVVILEV